MNEKNVLEYKFKRIQQAVSMSYKVIKKKSGEKILLNPHQLFMRFIAMASLIKDGYENEGVDTKTMMEHELCTFPPSLFESGVMLTLTKPKLVDGLKKYLDTNRLNSGRKSI